MTAIDDFLAKLITATGPSSLAATLPEAFSVSASGPYPLAKHVEIPGNPTGGELLLSFDNISVAPIALALIAPDATAKRITVTLKPARLTGTYDLFGLENPKVELDTGGALAPIPGFDDATTITEKQYDQLEQANQQRAELHETKNGRALVEMYNQHNDAYNDVFNTNSQLRKAWSAGGATDEMSDYTSDVLKNYEIFKKIFPGGIDGNPVFSEVVNPEPMNRTFGSKKQSYNQNAFSQKLNVWAACQKFYPDAGAAVMNFQGMVNTTGNTEKDIVPMTPEAVYQAVNSASEDKARSASTPPTDLHEALTRIVNNNHDDADLAVCEAHGFIMDEETQARLQAIHGEALRLHDSQRRLSLQSGPISADLPESQFVFTLTEQPDGALTVKLQRNTLSIPALDLDTSSWPGQAGQAGRDRLGSARFIRGILEDRIASQLTRILRTLASQEV